MSDSELLHTYATTSANDAFAQLVTRHLGFVYASALRQTRCSALAEDVAQAVFLDLAHYARKLRPDTHLASWLCVTTRHKAIDAIRTESRRRKREQIATELATMNSSDPAWTHLEPVLDEALTALNDADRRAVLLRFYENQSLAEIGRQLGMTDDTAQKRVARSLDRLRQLLARRGIVTTAALLATQIPAHAVSAAPAQLAQLVTSSVVLSAAPASASLTRTLIMTLSKKSFLAGALALSLASAFTNLSSLTVSASNWPPPKPSPRHISARLSSCKPSSPPRSDPPANWLQPPPQLRHLRWIRLKRVSAPSSLAWKN